VTEDIFKGIFDKAAAIQERWPHLPYYHFRWRVGREAFMEIADEAAGPPPSHALDDLGPRFASRSWAEHERWRVRREALKEAWGKEGSALFGWPVVCDEDFEGIEPEVVLV